MISTTESSAENKKLALDKLRFSRNHAANRDQTPPSSSSLSQEPLGLTSFTQPPPQSRDASMPSRFFPSSPPSLGNVLVPNSSPIAQVDNNVSPYRPYGLLMNHNVSSSSSSFTKNGWLDASMGSGFDPLSAPGGLITHGSTLNAFSRRRIDGHADREHEDGPPRKKLNRGSSEGAFTIPDSPPSPEIQRAGHRRHISAIGADAMSLSSDDSQEYGNTLAGPSKPRLTKARPASSPEATPMSEPPLDREYISFKISHPTESPVRIQAAWKQASGDVKRAIGFLLDPGWSPTPVAPKEVFSRVKEIEEATRAQRAADKEKGKKSMIYANRGVLEIRAPATPPSKPVINFVTPTPATPTSPITPAIKAPQGKRAKKLVVDSDSESAADDANDNREVNRTRQGNIFERRALDYLNNSDSDALQDLTGCTPDQAQILITLRPFTSGDDIRSKLGQGKKKAGPTGISPRMFEDCTEMFQGYGSVDNVLEDCERIGAELRVSISSWTPSRDVQDTEDGAVSLLTLGSLKDRTGYLTSQPDLLSDTVTLKEYQLLGVNWLNLLYRSNLSCILADEMGLGKTIQVISFLAYLKQIGKKGPHLIVVPSSTLENWCREFARFAPSISIQTYYGEKNERAFLRQNLRDTQRGTVKQDGWDVLITTYNLAQGDERDRHFFRKLDWDCCIFDEGHVLKNFQSQRYQSLLKFPYNWRLLLTGTPLQNNLQELVSLLNFILPDQFAESLEHLRAIFKVKGDAKVSLLSQERISRAKKMVTPFVLRRRKDQVLKDLPTKTERIEWCEMTDLQHSIYRDTLQRSRKILSERLDDSDECPHGFEESRIAPNAVSLWVHDETLRGITKQLLKEPDFKRRGA